MMAAIEDAKKGLSKFEGGPFGACIIKHSKVLAVSHNKVLKNQDPTSHAEINVIREASKKLGTFDLSGCIIYSTTEPCPMCFSAIHWARISKVFFGTKIQDVQKRGFHELTIPNGILKRLGKSPVSIQSNYFRKECLKLLEAWDKLKDKQVY